MMLLYESHPCQSFRVALVLHNHNHHYYYVPYHIGDGHQTSIPRHRMVSSIAAATTSQNEDTKSANAVKIYDNVYDTETCLLLHHLAKEHSDRIGDDSSIFYRNHPRNTWTQNKTTSTRDEHRRPMTPIEYAIDAILTNVCNDTTTNIVEYWSRQDYLNMDVHCDIDEKLLEKNKRFLRYPEFAHILYLTVQLPTNVTAPTCIFPTKLGGWRMTPSDRTHENSLPVVDLVIVPAVSGRLVRFPGAMMHAVPKPSNQWFTTSTTATISHDVESTSDQEHHDIDDYGYDENVDHSHPIELRSVLLFNCWPNDMPPPIGLKTCNDLDNTRRLNDDVPDGIVIDDDNANDAFQDSHQIPSVPILLDDDYQSTFAIDNHWNATPIMKMVYPPGVSVPTTTATTATASTLRARLMGNKYRRQFDKAVATLSIHQDYESVLLQAFNEAITPTRIQLLQSNDA
jgi:hypothetical protein